MPASPVFHGLDVCSAIPDGVPLWLDGVPLKLDGVSLTLDSVPQALDAVSMLSDRVSPASDAVSGTADGFPAGQRRILRWLSCFCIKTTNQTSQLMKKSICLAASLLALNLTPVFGQPTPPLPVQTQPRYAPPGVPPQPSDNFQQRLHEILNRANPPQNEAPALTKFNLDFPGGTPKELVAAIEKAMGKPLNAIIPDEDAPTQLPSLKLNNVNVAELFRALTISSPGTFLSADPTTDDSIWAFRIAHPSGPSEKICQFYALTPYLDKGFTVDDITTAIQTGWKMAGETATPELNYHKETKLLIAFGEPNKLQTIQQVLQTLPTVKNDYWAQMATRVGQLQMRVDQLTKNVSSSATNSMPEEKSGK